LKNSLNRHRRIFKLAGKELFGMHDGLGDHSRRSHRHYGSKVLGGSDSGRNLLMPHGDYGTAESPTAPRVAWVDACVETEAELTQLVRGLRPPLGWCFVVRAPALFRDRTAVDALELLSAAALAPVGLARAGMPPRSNQVLVDPAGDLRYEDGAFTAAPRVPEQEACPEQSADPASAANDTMDETLAELDSLHLGFSALEIALEPIVFFFDAELKLRRQSEAAAGLFRTRTGMSADAVSRRLNDEALAADASAILVGESPSAASVSGHDERSYFRLLHPQRDPDGNIRGATAALLEVTKLRQSVDRLHRKARQQALVAQLGRYAVTEPDPARLLSGIAEALVRGLEMDCAAVLYWDQAAAAYRVAVGHGCFPWEPGAVVDEEQGAGWLRLARTQEAPTLVDDFALDRRFRPPQRLLEQQFRSGLAITLSSGGIEHGLLCALARRPDKFDEEDAAFFQAVSGLILEAVSRRHAEQRMAEIGHALEQRVGERMRLLRLLKNIADIINASEAFSDAVWATCREVEALLGWSEAEAVLTERGRQLLGESHMALPDLKGEWVTDPTQLPTAARELLTTTLASGQPEQLPADGSGLCALPIALDGSAVAALLFTIPAGQPADETVLQVLGNVGGQLSRVLERNRARELTIHHLGELAHLDRVATMGELAAGLAHELGQPLGSIRFYAGGLGRILQELPEGIGADVLDAVRRIAAESERAGRVVEALRSFSKKGEVPLGKVDVGLAFDHALELTASAARRAEVRILRPEAIQIEPPHGNQLYVEQILINLVLNAVEACQAVPVERRVVRVFPWSSHNTVLMTVENPRQGERLDLNRFFEPFYTTKPEGLGIGLAISRRLAEAQEGRLWAESDDQAVRLHLQLSAAPNRAGAPPARV
jgi:C4-dicarboxylate-specific signal transduction histidine kinase